MRLVFLLVPLGILFGLSACAMAPTAVPERSSLRPPSLVITESVVPAADEAGTATMTLAQAIETALLNNPSLQADFAQFEGMALMVPQVTSLPDPNVTYTQVVEGVHTRLGEQDFNASVSQMFPWFGELRLQGRIADSEAKQALESFRAGMLDVRRDVTFAWHRLAYEQAAEALAREDKAILQQSLEAAAALYGSDQRGRGALLKAQTEMTRIENDLTGYPPRIAALREELRRLLFVDHLDAVPPLDPNARQHAALPHAQALIDDALALRPEIERSRLREQQARLQQDLVRKDDYPDFTVGVNYADAADAWGVSLGLNIPLPNARRRAAKQQAAKELEEAQWRRLTAESSIAQDVRSLLPRLRALDEQLDILRDNLLPLANEAYGANQAAYTSGQATFLDLLDAQRTLLAVRRDLLRTQLDTLVANAELERAVGASLTMKPLEGQP